ncbi:MAG: MFS transporter, partial [Candidatus Obscuribacterales bacterium]|nr:MFS transporter [Candidatus Obscuribacterales bacterium]
HFSAWSSGVVCAGFIGDRCMKKFGKRRVVWTACSGLVAGIITIITAQLPAITIAGAFLAGVCGSTMSQTMCVIIADRFLDLRAVAIAEANIAASVCCSLSPVAISLFSKTSLGWRAALLLPIVAFLTYYLKGRHVLETVVEPEHKNTTGTGKLPAAYWLCWTLVLFSVASEWTIIYWCADFLEKVSGLSKADAAASVSSFLLAMVTGRVIGSRLAREMKSQNMLKIASIISLVGFIVFWKGTSAAISICGLFVAGLGIANFYPLTLSLAIGTAPGLSSTATSRMSLASGASTLFAPFLLSIVAEKSGIAAAYGIVAVLLVLCIIMVFLPIWSSKRSSS